MIIVTGATGQLGHAITLQLISRFPANEVGVSVRDPKKPADLEALDVRVRQADFDNPKACDMLSRVRIRCYSFLLMWALPEAIPFRSTVRPSRLRRP